MTIIKHFAERASEWLNWLLVTDTQHQNAAARRVLRAGQRQR